MPETTRFKDNYCWLIVAATFLLLMLNWGAQQYAFGVMFKPIITEFGWSRSGISFAFCVNMVVLSVSLIVVGRLYDRFGPKWIIILSSLLICVGYLITSRIQNFGQFLVSYGLLAAMGSAGTGIPLVSMIVSKWFVKWRGMAIGLAMAGSSIGSFFIVPLLSSAVASFGWRSCFVFLGLVLPVFNILIALTILRGDPRQIGAMPFGAVRPETTPVAGSATVAEDTLPSLGLKAAARTRSFWLFAVTMVLCGSGDYLVTTHFINFATDQGVSPLTAGNMMGWFGLLSMAGVLLVSPAADRFGSRAPILLTFLLRALLLIFILFSTSVVSMYIFTLLFGFTLMITAPLTPMLLGRLYGFGKIGILTGAINTVHFLGAGVWPYFAGLIFDLTGSYRLAFLLSAVMAVIAALCSYFIVEKRHTQNSAPVVA